MKKKTLFILSLAILLMITGGIGATIFYQRLEAERKASEVSEKFKYDGTKELELVFKNGANVNISTSEDDYIRMNKNGINFGKQPKQSATWDIQTKNDKTIVTIDNNIKEQQIERRFFSFGSITEDSIYLRLPDKYDSIKIAGNNVNVNVDRLSTQTLSLESKRGYISVYDSNVQNLAAETKYGDIDINGVKAEEAITLTSLAGNISAQDSRSNALTITSKNGDIFSANTKGNLTMASDNGFISVNHTIGLTDIKNKNNDIFYHTDKMTKDVTLETTHGDIAIETDKPSIEKNSVKFDTTNGVISIFNKNLSSETEYKQTKGDATISAISKNGNINVDELEDDDDHY